MELQQKISSPEIQRLSEFRDEILSDLDSLEIKVDPSSGNEEDRPPADALVKQYIALNKDLAHCLQACSQFHEEAFILETTIMEIKKRPVEKGTNMDILRELLDGEWSVYTDLANRIDSSIENVNNHRKFFSALKPAIDSIMSLD